ncbi:MAG: hypothetical protein Q9181_002878 [Wetmoreana brouardii]
MARLNEPSTQVESVEALRRRFLRQNRELAKTTGEQSIKIRNLESELARLLSENIVLREQVIKLQFEVDNNAGLDGITAVKGKLEAKLVELGGLVEELGAVQQSAEDRRALRRGSGAKASPKRSPGQKDWRNGANISEVMAGADGRLPPIVEGKYYPRRTLDADEMLGLARKSDEIADSPELGPPPIAHFEAGDPIKYDSRQDESGKKPKLESTEELNPALLVNLETRRKRRESSQRADPALSAQSQASYQENLDRQPKKEHPLKSGAKRKFNAREDEGQIEATTAPARDDFQFSRSTNAAQSENTDHTRPVSDENERQARQRPSEDHARSRDGSREKPKANSSAVSGGRNVLAPSKLALYVSPLRTTLTDVTESVNTDPVSSPIKTRRPVEGDKTAPLKRDLPSKPRDRSRASDQKPSQRFARPSRESQAGATESNTAPQDMPPPSRPAPETPAPLPLDVLSPEDSEPPAARPEGRDTPPPGDLDPDTANTNSFGSLGRTSRRQRGSVSYAEPNLRDKMRRPTKELVDAVGAEERLQQGKALKRELELGETEPTVTGEAPSKMRTVVVKKEPMADGALDWKTLPIKEGRSDQKRQRANAASPLDERASTAKADLPASVVTERRRRPSVLDRERPTGGGESQGSGAASTIAALNHAKPKPREGSVHVDDVQNALKLSEPARLHEKEDSSPAEAEGVAAQARTIKPAVARASRRHSNISDDRLKDAMARRAERRKEVAGDGKSGGVPDLKNMRSAAALAVESGEGAQTRVERAASRRRSMML